MTFKFGSVCSGIEAASVAFGTLGWSAAWLAEIEPFPSAVLAHHYPDVPNLGDMTAIPRRVLSGEIEAPDMLCGGTPCQAFSIAGLRESLSDERGNLTLKFVEIADAIDHVRARRGEPPAVVLWENVPGVLSTKDNAFGCFLAGLAGEDDPLEPPGGRWANAGAVYGPARAIAWRTLDAQYFGLAQRRRRVFVVASARDGFDPARVLFEWDGVRRDTAPSREKGETTSNRTGDGAFFRCKCGYEFAERLGAYGCPNCEGESGFAHLIKRAIAMAHGQGGAEIGYDCGPTLTCNHEAPIVAFDTTQITSAANRSNPPPGGPCHPPAVAFGFNWQNGGGYGNANDGLAITREGTGPLQRAQTPAVAHALQVRRLTQRECERLMGFPPVLEILRIEVCIDHQNKNAVAAIRCHKLQSSVWSAAESEYLQFASTAGKNSATDPACQGRHAAVYARQHCAGSLLVLRKNQNELNSSASNAGKQNWSRSHTQGGSFAALLAPHWESLAKEITHGKAASHQHIKLSLTGRSGAKSAEQSGEESAENANGAEIDANGERCITSPLGRVTPTCDSKIATSLCSVIRATSSFIQSETLNTSFCIDLVLERDYTAIPYRNKPASQCPAGPRYKALGNSWAVPCVQWIGRRIHSAILSTERPAP